MSYRQKLLAFFPVIILAAFFGYRLFYLTQAQADEPTTNPTIISSDSTHPIQTFTVDSRARSIVSAFTLAGVSYYPQDQVTAFPDPSLGLGTTITIKRALALTIKDGKHRLVVRTWQPTLAEVLNEQKIELGNDDKISQSLSADLTGDSQVVITRVALTTVKETEPIDFKITKKEDSTLDQGKTRIERAGKTGVRTFSFLVKREDGELVSKTLTNNEVTTTPVDQILIVGTRPIITTACRYNDLVIEAAIKYSVDPNALCYRMMAESQGNPKSDSGIYKGLFQYEPSFWATASTKAGFTGASILDAKAQVFTTAWAWSHGLRGRWPTP